MGTLLDSYGLALRAPLVQAPLGTCGTIALAAAVSQAGGLGCLSLHAPTLAATRLRLERLRQRTRRPVLLAFTAEWESEAILDHCLAAGHRHFMTLWWNGPRLARRIRAAGGTVFWQVGTLAQAEEAVENRADILIVQGTEAGGPVRSPHPRTMLLAQLRAALGPNQTLVVGGGLADRADVAQVLTEGADLAFLGTRFLLTEEAQLPDRHRQRLLRATAEELLLDTRLVGSWPCSPRRRLPTFTEPDAPSLFAGLGLTKIHTVLPAATLVRQLSAGL